MQAFSPAFRSELTIKPRLSNWRGFSCRKSVPKITARGGIIYTSHEKLTFFIFQGLDLSAGEYVLKLKADKL